MEGWYFCQQVWLYIFEDFRVNLVVSDQLRGLFSVDVETSPLTMISPREEVMPEEKPLEKVLSPERSSLERQVSPEKLLRAALLRGRYADLIVKAQQKSLPISKVGPGL